MRNKIVCSCCGCDIYIPKCRIGGKKYAVFACKSCRGTKKYKEMVSEVMLNERGFPVGFHSLDEYSRFLFLSEVVPKRCTRCGKVFNGQRSDHDLCSQECAEIVRVERIADTKELRYGFSGFNNRKKAKHTRVERYGSDSYWNEEKTKRTCLEIYGVDNPSKSKVVLDRIRETTNANYGVDNYFKRGDLVKGDWVRTIGCDNPQKNGEINTRTRGCVKSKYGDLAGAVPRMPKEKTCFERFGNKEFFGSELGRMSVGNLKSVYGWTDEEIKKLIESRRNSVSFGKASKESLRFFVPLYRKLRKAGIDKDDVCWGIGKSSELWLHNIVQDRVFFYDFAIKSLKIIVEFNGSKFHAKTENDKLLYRNAKTQMATDAIKKKTAEDLGYAFFVVWDYEATVSRIDEMFGAIQVRRINETV